MLTNNVCTAQLAPARLFFLALQVLEFHTHVTVCAMGLLLLSALSFCILSLSFSLARSSARSHIPVGGTPYCFTQRDQFLFHSTFLSFSLPLSLARSFFSLSLYGLLYALSSVPFVHARLFARADFEPDSPRSLRREKRRRGSDESGQTAREQNDGREKK